MKARDNPFAIDHIEALLDFEPEWCGIDWPDLIDRWQDLNYRAAIVGPHGSGKSTLLRTLERRLQSDNSTRIFHFFLNDQRRDLEQSEWHALESCRSNTATAVVLVDGAEQFKRRSWLRFRRIIATNTGTIRSLVSQHHGSLLRWPTLLTTTPTPDLLAHLIEKLAPDFRRFLTESEIGNLLARHRGNIREALRECYDSCAAEPSIGDG